MENWFPVGKEGANKTYLSQSECEAAEGQACYEVSGKDLRYHTVVDGVLTEDAELKATIEAADAASAAEEGAILEKMRNMEFGKRVIAAISVRNDAKELEPADVVSLVSTYGTIQMLLMSGSIVTARAQINAITPDGTLVTADDKTEILAMIDDYLT